ncbi:MAG: UbiA prenyltransferase family protein [Bifidobacteriaceae bacterium]|jgi:4-hydroxybenzoate polyprenyltransferase|nr:UbiA prenyltransferase family protein [Bifidobacteriaceae bacterium]
MSTATVVRRYERIARPDHWIKNLFVLPGAVFALALVEPLALSWSVVGKALLAAVATCPVASANYVINEWLDAATDKYHPVKRYRVAVTEGVRGRYVLEEYAVLALVGLALSWPLGWAVLASEAFLLVMGVLYNVRPIRLKDLPFVDVLSESINNLIRLGIGWFAVAGHWLPPASLMIGYWMGGAFLMGVKRFAEYRMIHDPELAGKYRLSFRHYSMRSLLTSSGLYALLSVFFTGVFLLKYRIELILFVPFLCGLFAYYIAIAFKDDSAVQKPEKLYRERGLMGYSFGLAVLFFVLLFVRMPWLDNLLNPTLLPLR